MKSINTLVSNYTYLQLITQRVMDNQRLPTRLLSHMYIIWSSTTKLTRRPYYQLPDLCTTTTNTHTPECPCSRQISDTNPHMVGFHHPSNASLWLRVEYSRLKRSNSSSLDTSKKPNIQWNRNSTKVSTTHHKEHEWAILAEQKEKFNKTVQHQTVSQMTGTLFFHFSTDVYICSQTDTSLFHERWPPSVSCICPTQEWARLDCRTKPARTQTCWDKH